MTEGSGLITRPGGQDAAETVRRLRAAIDAVGLTLFADVDHAAGAAAVGMALRPTRLLLFGSPRGGTPLMQVAQTAGLDLPLKILVWEDEAGRAWLTWNDPHWIAARHGAGQAAADAVEAMAAGLEALAGAALG